MRFWDSSAIIPLLIPEEQSECVRNLLKSDPYMLVWTLTPVECFSAFYRRDREKKIHSEIFISFGTKLRQLERAWTEVIHLESVKRRAERLLSTHSLRAADSLQLAAALVAFEENTHTAEFVTLDGKLADAARREGFQLVV